MNPTNTFSDLALSSHLLKTLTKLSFMEPTAVQTQVIPLMLKGHDILGQSQTGTGKTGAFALPIIERINVKDKKTQCLVLAPTRELAIQVAEAFRQFGDSIKGLTVCAIFGGEGYRRQLRELPTAQIIVGTPGRVMDHLRRGTMVLDAIKYLVIDEADEMLQMGFINDVEWIMSHTPKQKQIALFSATMPKHIHRLAEKYLSDPKRVTVKKSEMTVNKIRQRYLIVKEPNKIEALNRILTTECHSGVIIFARTKVDTFDIAKALRGMKFSAEVLNGDITQNERKRTVDKLKSGKVDIVVATDVAARGIDISRISCVINFHMPYDNETYVHRIGRTGRAGREGDAILFISPRETHKLKNLESAINTRLIKMALPTHEVVAEKRFADFQKKISSITLQQELSKYKKMISHLADHSKLDLLDIAAALTYLSEESQNAQHISQ